MYKRSFLAALLAAALFVCPAQATLNSTSNTVTYVANGATTSFTVPFKFLASTDLVVTVAGAPKTLNSDYTVTGAGNATGSVKFTTAPANLAAVVITRAVDYLQKTSLAQNRTPDPRTVESALDKLAMGEQQLQALYTNPPATILPSNVTARLNGIRFADQFANIQAAITDAGTTGSVLIPSSYLGVDSYTNPNNIPILDLRGGNGQWWNRAGIVFAQDQGPVCNGTADDTAKLQAAITAGGGKTVVLPSGPCAAAGTLNVTVANTRIIGSGGSIIPKFTSALPAGGVLFNVTASGVEFDGVKIDGTGIANSPIATINHYAIRFQGSSGTHLTNAKVRNCTILNLPWNDTLGAVVASHAIYLQWVDGALITGNVIDGPAGAGVFMSASTNIDVLANRINNTGWYSIQANDQVNGFRISGNRITGTAPGSRVWGGSINLMSNSSTGTACGTPGCAQIRNGDVDHNYISGVHSYTAAVHIESSSHIRFHHNAIESVTLTSAADMLARYGQHFGSGTNPFYPDGTPAAYVRPYVRPTNVPANGNEGPNDHIEISDNDLIAGSISAQGIYFDAQDNGSGTLAYSDTIVIKGNRLQSLDSTHYFGKGIIGHGQQGGWRHVGIIENFVSGFPDTASPVSGLIGVTANSGAPMTDIQIVGNSLALVGGTPSSSTHLGIAVDAYAQVVQLSRNSISGFFHGLRTFANASAIFLGPGNVFSGNTTNTVYGVGAFPTPTVGGTVSPITDPIVVPARGADLAATTIVSLADAGDYRVCASARTSTAGTGSGPPTLNIIWTDEGGAKTHALGTFVLNVVTAGAQVNGCDFVHAVAGSNIQVSVTGGTYGTSQYVLTATAEKLR